MTREQRREEIVQILNDMLRQHYGKVQIKSHTDQMFASGWVFAETKKVVERNYEEICQEIIDRAVNAILNL